MRAHEFLQEQQIREDVENFPIANVRRPNGAIGNQGVNTEQAADVLTHAAGMQVSPDMSMRQLVDALKADPVAQQRLGQFVAQNPVTVSALPDGSYHLLDGHHRTFLLNLLGDETVPAIVKEDASNSGNPVNFIVSSPDGYQHSFQITLAVHGKHVGHFNFVRSADTDDVNNEAEVESRWQGQGYGKLLLMKAIDVANNHGLDFQQDIRGITDAQQNVYDSLENAGLIVTPGDGFWFLTPQGEQELNGLNENFADGRHPERKELDPEIYEDLDNGIIARVARQLVPTIRAKSTPEGYVYLKTADGLSLVIGCSIAGGSIGINIGTGHETTSSGPHKGAVTEIVQAVYAAAVKHYGTPSQPGSLSVDHDAGHGVWQHIAQKLGLEYSAHMVKENFADGRHPEDKGDSKRLGVPTKSSVSSLRKYAKSHSGRKAQLAHWMANMKSGKKKNK